MTKIEILDGATCANCGNGEMHAVQYGFSCDANEDGSLYRARVSIIYHCSECLQVDTDVQRGDWSKLVDALREIRQWQIQLRI
jgi:hypothetical protein